MTDESENETLPLHEKLQIMKLLMEKLHGFNVADIDADIAKAGIVAPWESALVQAKWSKIVDLLFEVGKVYERRYAGKRGELRLIEEVFGDQLNLPNRVLKQDVDERLERYRRLIAKDFERGVRETIRDHSISSPVEQIFLMEWRYLGMDHRFGVKLQPQLEIKCGETTYRTDFAVMRKGGDFRVCIEIDGHDFHEKTRAQVAADKARERALIKEGYTVLRFTGSEVVRDAKKCVEEVRDVIAKNIG